MNSEPTADDLIQNGIRAAQEGDRARAKAYLSKAVLAKPDSEEAWWWLGQSVDDPEQQRYCFQKVLAINPMHEGAKAALSPPESTPPFLQDEVEATSPPPSTADQADEDMWGKPEVKSTRRSSSQQVVIILLVLALLCVAIVGGGYIFLDSSGLLGSVSILPTPTAPQKPTSTISGESGTLVLPPTWTPTASLTPPPLPSPGPATSIPTIEPSPTATISPPTPEATPAISAALPAGLAQGTGIFTLEADEIRVYEFTSEVSLDLQAVVVLTNHLIGIEQGEPPQIVLYLWDLDNETWDARVPSWGNNTILSPNAFVNNDGTILAALWNWSDSSIEVLEFGFTIGGRQVDGTNVYFGLSEPEPRVIVEPTVPPTVPFTDG